MSDQNHQHVTISWANPAPAGLVALAIACFCFYAVLTGTCKGTAIPLLGCWLIGGFVVQIVVAIIELMEGAVQGGNVFLYFSAFFMLTGGLEFFVKAYFNTMNTAAGVAPIDTTIDGWAWMVLTIATILFTPAYLKNSGAVMGLCVVLLDIAIIFVTGTDGGWLPKATYSPIAGYFLLGAGICGIYVAAGAFLAGTIGKSILPMPGPILK